VGVHRLRVARLGYAPSLRDVTVLEGATFEVHFVLGAEITVSSAPTAIPDPDALQIRERTSDGPDPLVLVNGVAVRGMGATRRDVLAQLDPNDIARIEIISGPAAVARYGPEGLGGVIQVFLKEP
jgi:outer membrane receptor protein involved in Fe transport